MKAYDHKQKLLAFDVGGTAIKAGILAADGGRLAGSLAEYPAHADGSADRIIAHLTAIAAQQAAMLTRPGIHAANDEGAGQIAAIGYAFPGPFDYEEGISYIRGLNKFDVLYGLPLRARLEESMRTHPLLGPLLASDLRLLFANDAALYALGEARFGHAAGKSRAVCLTLGTGLGSAFLLQGHLLKNHADIPPDGWLYPTPYEGRSADELVSRRGLLDLAASLGLEADPASGRDVKQLAEQALIGGDPRAYELFRLFGERMARVLVTPLALFQPEVVVLGGQIAKSGNLFAPAFAEGLRSRGLVTQVALSDNTLLRTMQGIYQLYHQPR
jgi:glucokinase